MSPWKFGSAVVGACACAAACSPDLSLLEGASFTDLAGSPSMGAGEPQGGVDEGGSSTGATGSGATSGAAGHEGGSSGSGGLNAGGASGGSLGAAGAAGAMPAPCVPTGVETCNGVDDDCDGVVDQGCPGGVKTTFEKDLQLLGDSPQGQLFTDDCRDGELLAGVSAVMGQYLSQIAGVCRSVSLELSTNQDFGYQVKLDAERALGAHPATADAKPVRLTCPEDEAVVGMRLAQQNYAPPDAATGAVTTRIWITCAKLALTGAADQSAIVWTGAKEEAPLSGTLADQTAWFVQASAPDKLVASRIIGASDDRVERVSFGVSRLNLLTR